MLILKGLTLHQNCAADVTCSGDKIGPTAELATDVPNVQATREPGICQEGRTAGHSSFFRFPSRVGAGEFEVDRQAGWG